jgi:hypothetical protein
LIFIHDECESFWLAGFFIPWHVDIDNFAESDMEKLVERVRLVADGADGFREGMGKDSL